MAAVTVSNLSAYTHESIAISNTAGGYGFTATNLRQFGTQKASAREVLVTVETDSIRFTVDGTVPTSTVGHLVTSGGSIIVNGLDNITKFLCIRVTGDCTIKVTYYQ